MADNPPTMQLHSNWADLPSHVRGATVAMGNFDGVHLGHAHLIRIAHAARPDLPLAVVTFEPHPRELFRPQDPPFRLQLPAERREALADLGVKIVYELEFTRAFSQMTADEFITNVLARGIGAAHLACGPDFAFGNRRGGGLDLLTARAEELGIGLTVVPSWSDAEGPLSSSRIRRDLQDGYPERATAELGRPWTIRGVVVHGEKRGRNIGFPTANIALGRYLEPARGVYAVTVRLPDGSTRRGVANIGRRPTVYYGTESRLEVHLFDFDADLYGQELSVALLKFIRAEQKFENVAALRAQIGQDVAAARVLLG